jgi:hypothetical protein
MINRDILEKKYEAGFVLSVDDAAWAKLTEMETGSAFNKNSIHRDSRGNQQAMLTEHYFLEVLKKNGIVYEKKTADHELWDFVVLNRKIDMKSKRRNSNPVDYEYHVDGSQINHPVDVYIFSDVFYETKRDQQPVYFAYAGWTNKRDFMFDSVEKRKGEVCPQTGFVEKADCRKLNSFWLRKMQELLDRMKELQGA